MTLADLTGGDADVSAVLQSGTFALAATVDAGFHIEASTLSEYHLQAEADLAFGGALSVQVAAPLVALIEALPPQTALVASGTSCRHQIQHLCNHPPQHMAELLADALPPAEEEEKA